MDVQSATELGREALTTALLIGAPVLCVGVLVGLLIGLVQALTQIQDQTISFVPKIVTMVLVLVICLPWLIQRMLDYSEDLIVNIPRTIFGGSAAVVSTLQPFTLPPHVFPSDTVSEPVPCLRLGSNPSQWPGCNRPGLGLVCDTGSYSRVLGGELVADYYSALLADAHREYGQSGSPGSADGL